MLLSKGISVILSDLHPNTALSLAIYTPSLVIYTLTLSCP